MNKKSGYSIYIFLMLLGGLFSLALYADRADSNVKTQKPQWEVIWEDRGTGGDEDLSVWTIGQKEEYALFGHVTGSKYKKPPISLMKLMKRDTSAVIPPKDFKLIWKDTGSGAEQDGAFWKLICPDGYVSLGDIVTKGYEKSLAFDSGVLCLAKKYAKKSKLAHLYWSDRGAGSEKDVSIWAIAGSPYFYVSLGYERPNAEVWTFQSKEFNPKRVKHRFSIRFDYRFAGDYFKDPKKRKPLETAAEIWGDLITSDFEAIPAGTVIKVWHPKEKEYYHVTLKEDIEDLLIFVFAYDFKSSTKAFAGPFGSWINGSSLDTRYNKKPFQPWVGKLSINTNPGRPWFFDQTPNSSYDIPSQTHHDLQSTALHEIGHILGFLVSVYKQTGNYQQKNRFTGAYAREVNNQKAVILDNDSSHISRKNTHGLARPGIDEYIMSGASVLSGFRHYPTHLDLMMLQDIGYKVNWAALDGYKKFYKTHPGQERIQAQYKNLKKPIVYWELQNIKNIYSPIMGSPLLYMPPAKNPEKNPLREVSGGIQVPKGAYLILDHSQKGNGGGKHLNVYSIVMDIRLPKAGVDYALYNTNTSNNNNGDAYISPEGKVGQGGYSEFKLEAKRWYRLTLTVDEVNNKRKYYVDGKLIFEQSSGGLDGRFTITGKGQGAPIFLLFASADINEDNDIDVKRMAFFDFVLSEAEVKNLKNTGSSIAF